MPPVQECKEWMIQSVKQICTESEGLVCLTVQYGLNSIFVVWRILREKCLVSLLADINKHIFESQTVSGSLPMSVPDKRLNILKVEE